MESYSQPWTVVNKYEQYQSEPKTYEYYAFGLEGGKKHYETAYEKPQYSGKWEKTPEYSGNKTHEYSGKWDNKTHEYSGKWDNKTHEHSSKPEYYGKYEKPEYYGGKYEKPEYYGKYEKPEYYGGKYEKPEYYGKYEKPEYYGKEEKPSHVYKNIENIYGEWEKVTDSLERCQLERPNHEGRWENVKPHWRCSGKNCCDEEMVKLVKDLINILIGAEQSYIQLGFLCMDEKLTLVNTSEYFRLCGLRMRWLANGLIARSVRLFNVTEWINNTTFENWFKVPSKEELATNDYTSVIKTFFKIAMESENRLVERMNLLGEKIMKTDFVNTECRFDGFKWFVNFVLPYQVNFVREMNGHWRNIEMCNNGFIFDKCEMYPLVQKIEELIHQITKINTTGLPVWQKNVIIPTGNKW